MLLTSSFAGGLRDSDGGSKAADVTVSRSDKAGVVPGSVSATV